MKTGISRRTCIGGIGTAVLMMSSASGNSAETGEKKLAIDRSGIDWNGRPMYLRPYHPPYVVYYYGMMRENKLTSQPGIVKWGPLIKRIENEPKLTVLIIQAYDDACAGCYSLKPDPNGHPWGVGYSCGADPAKVRDVTRYSRRILDDLGLDYGSEISMRELVSLLAINVPVLYEGIGGEGNQQLYEKGLGYLKQKYGI